MKDDTISRAAALNCVYGTSPNKIKGRIAELPSAQPVNIAKLQPNCNQVASDCASDCASHCASDVISRQAAISICDNAIDLWNGQLGTGALVAVRDAIMALPSAQPVVISKSENATECDDAVSREAVLNEIHRYMEERDYTIGLLDDNVCGLPPVTPKQPGWIPTSERLPDNDRAVLVTLKWAEDDYEVAVGEYWHNSTASHGWGSFEGHVIAWHELPTPYREGGQDGKN